MSSTSTISPSNISAYTSITVVRPTSIVLNTEKYFLKNHVEPKRSPIDNFIFNTNKLNVLSTNPKLSWEESVYLIVGYVSAVENYFRYLIRSIINSDEYTKVIVESLDVSFAAAINNEKSILPESLMEKYSFASTQGIKEGLRALVGINPQYSPAIEALMKEYNKICQLRHCCVHRFGKLGTKSALELGFGSHNTLIEKPLNLNNIDIQNISELLRTLIKSINNYLFVKLIDRVAKSKNKGMPYWKGTYQMDQKLFKIYYKLFATNLDSIPSPPIREVYKSFKSATLKK